MMKLFQLKVKALMRKRIQTVHVQYTIEQAAQCMLKVPVSALAVSDGKKIVGIITERDIVRRIIAKGKDPKTTKVRSAMSRKIIGVDKDATLVVAAHLMQKTGKKKLFVTHKKNICGIITQTDVIRGLSRESLHNGKH